MKLNSNARIKQRTLSILLITAFLLLQVACASQPGKSKNYYRLDFKAAPDTHSPAVKYDFIKVDTPHLASTHTTESILYSEAPYKQDAYSNSEWMVALPTLMQNWLLQSLEHMNLFKGVMRSSTRATAPLMLETDIIQFEHIVYESSVLVEIRVSLLDYETRKVVNQKSFRYRKTIDKQTAADAVAAFNALLVDFNRDLYQWLDNDTRHAR